MSGIHSMWTLNLGPTSLRPRSQPMYLLMSRRYHATLDMRPQQMMEALNPRAPFVVETRLQSPESQLHRKAE